MAYTLFVTVTNMSRTRQNAVSVSVHDNQITGAHKANAADSFIQTIETLEPENAATLEFELVSDTTGKRVATTFQSDSPGLEGSILLRTGVGELGIPLSPAMLVMPRFADRLARPQACRC